MTLSATLRSLATKRKLIRVTVELLPGDYERRLLYITRELDEWLFSNVKGKPKLGRQPLGPSAQVNAWATAFIVGKPMAGQWSKVDPIKHGIVKCHTPALRLFGFFVAKDYLVLTHAEWSKNTHGKGAFKVITQLRKDSVAKAKALKLQPLLGERYELL